MGQPNLLLYRSPNASNNWVARFFFDIQQFLDHVAIMYIVLTVVELNNPFLYALFLKLVLSMKNNRSKHMNK